MSSTNQAANPWQFSVRGLLRLTAIVAVLLTAYRVHPALGFVLTVGTSAVCLGRRQRALYSEARYGVIGSIVGGATACSVHFLIAVLRRGAPGNRSDLASIPGILGVAVDFTALCTFGSLFGAGIGVLAWYAWGVLGVFFFHKDQILSQGSFLVVSIAFIIIFCSYLSEARSTPDWLLPFCGAAIVAGLISLIAVTTRSLSND